MRWVLCLIALTAPALAETGATAKTVDCYCTDRQGARVDLGETICLTVDGKSFMAQCQMSLNNPMWRRISDGCLSSSLGEPRQPGLQPGGIHPKI